MLLKTVLSSLLFLSAYGNFVSYSNSSAAELQAVPADPDVGKNMFEMAETRGYYMEEHFVTTPDGYILNMFRIPNGKKSRNTADSKPAVILQHGLLDSSFTWVNNFEDESLAYILADAGFDVWMGNNRGNRYGRNHTTLVPDTDEQFWMFTWDEMASLDMPAMVHYVTDVAEVDSVGWVGHSEGTIQMFAAASSLTGFNKDNTFLHDAIKKINLFVALAPVAYVNNLASRAIQVLAKQYIVDEIFDRGIYEIGKWDDKLNELAPTICQKAENACELFLDVICGPTQHINNTRIQVYVSGTPAGTSTMNMLHWEQGVLNPNFQMYDFGTEELNMKHYSSATPPQYDLTSIPHTFKIALFSGNHDYLADPTDVKRMVEEIPSESVVHHDIQDTYAHLDYTWAYDANDLIYNQVTDLLLQYKN